MIGSRPVVKCLLAFFIPTSSNSENPPIVTPGSSSEHVRGKFLSLLFLKVAANWRPARGNANCASSGLEDLTEIDPGPDVPPSPDRSE